MLAATTTALPVRDIPARDAATERTRADRFAAVVANHGLILTGDTASRALAAVDFIDRISDFGADASGISRYVIRTGAAARVLFADFDEVSPLERGAVRRMVSDALDAADGPAPQALCDYCPETATHTFLDRDASWAGIPAKGCHAHAAEERSAGGRTERL